MDTTMTPIERLERVAVLFREILDLLPPGDIPSAYAPLGGAISVSLNRAGFPLVVEAGGRAFSSGADGYPSAQPTHEHAYLLLPSGSVVSSCRPIVPAAGGER